MQQITFISKMSFVVSIRVSTPGGIRPFMPALTGIKGLLLEWYLRALRTSCRRCSGTYPRCRRSPALYDAIWRQLQPEWSIRVSVDHILDEENLSRIPAEIREAQNLPLLLETAVELARREGCGETEHCGSAGVSGPGAILAADLSPTDMEQPDLAMTLTIMDRYYLGNTCLIEMAYLQRAASFQTGGALAHGYSGGIAAHRSQACSPAAGSALAERVTSFAPRQEGG